MASNKSMVNKILIFIFLVAGPSSRKNSEKKTEVSENDEMAINSRWDRADEIIKNMVVPEFPDKTFNVTDYGAVSRLGHF